MVAVAGLRLGAGDAGRERGVPDDLGSTVPSGPCLLWRTYTARGETIDKITNPGMPSSPPRGAGGAE